MVWEHLINKIVKISYNDTVNSVAIITGKLIEEKEDCITIDHNGILTTLPNEKIIKILDFSFMEIIKCLYCDYYNWFDTRREIESSKMLFCKKCRRPLWTGKK